MSINDNDDARAEIETELAQFSLEERQLMKDAAEQFASIPQDERVELEVIAQAQTQIQSFVQQAHAAAQEGDFDAAIIAQEQAIPLARAAGSSREALLQLSVLLYDLANYYQQANRHDGAVDALEEVVMLDERTGHPDLESDRVALEQARQMRAAAAGKAQVIAVIEAQMAQINSEDRDLLEEATQQFADLGQEEQGKMEAFAGTAVTYHQIQQLANQTRDVAVAARRGQADADILATQMEQAATQATEGEDPGSPWAEVAAFMQAVADLLHGQPIPPVPSAYTAHMAAIQKELDD